MCQFFSCISDGEGKVYYLDAVVRKKIIAGELPYSETDSHSVIADCFFPETNGGEEDRMNKYEYNPLTKRFQIDQLNTTDDSETVEEFCRELNFSTVVPELVIKDIVHPFEGRDGRFSEKALELLKEWASVWAFVGDSVGASVWDSVGASVGAYISSFFNLSHWKRFEHLDENINPFQSAIDLWEMGLVPSFDGETWRLHAKSGIVWEGTLE